MGDFFSINLTKKNAKKTKGEMFYIHRYAVTSLNSKLYNFINSWNQIKTPYRTYKFDLLVAAILISNLVLQFWKLFFCCIIFCLLFHSWKSRHRTTDLMSVTVYYFDLFILVLIWMPFHISWHITSITSHLYSLGIMSKKFKFIIPW